VSTRGGFSGHPVSLVIAHIAKGASLTFPPINGSFSTSVTLTAPLPHNSGLVTFYAGPQTGGAITRNRTMMVGPTGQSGRLTLVMSSVTEIDGVLLGAQLSGAWRCP
jgi:hypothetical protein